VPKQQCKKVPEQQCQQEAYLAPQQVCEDVHRKIPQRTSRSVPKKTCGSGGSGGSFNPQVERQEQAGGSYGGRGSSSGAFNFGGTGALAGSNVKSAATSEKQVRNGNPDAVKFG